MYVVQWLCVEHTKGFIRTEVDAKPCCDRYIELKRGNLEHACQRTIERLFKEKDSNISLWCYACRVEQNCDFYKEWFKHGIQYDCVIGDFTKGGYCKECKNKSRKCAGLRRYVKYYSAPLWLNTKSGVIIKSPHKPGNDYIYLIHSRAKQLPLIYYSILEHRFKPLRYITPSMRKVLTTFYEKETYETIVRLVSFYRQIRKISPTMKTEKILVLLWRNPELIKKELKKRIEPILVKLF